MRWTSLYHNYEPASLDNSNIDVKFALSAGSVSSANTWVNCVDIRTRTRLLICVPALSDNDPQICTKTIISAACWKHLHAHCAGTRHLRVLDQSMHGQSPWFTYGPQLSNFGGNPFLFCVDIYISGRELRYGSRLEVFLVFSS